MAEERAWLTPVGLAVVGLVIAANALGEVGLGTTGGARYVTAGVVVYVAAAVTFLLWSDAPTRVVVGLLLVMSTSAALTHHGDPTSSGGVGLYLGMAFAPLRLPVRTAAAVCVAGVVVFDLQLMLEAANQVVFVLVVTGGAGFFFALGVLLCREAEQRRQVAGLLRDLELSREAEKASATMAERARLAREMHDVLAHTLSGLVIQLDGTTMLARSRGTDPDVTEALTKAHGLARTGLLEARQAITALKGDPMPGPEALPALVDHHRHSTAGRCVLQIVGEPRQLPAESRLALYRAAQEGLSNVRKHARYADVTVRLSWDPDDVTLAVHNSADDGQRVAVRGTGHSKDLGASGGGYGLSGIAERAELLGGSFEAGPTPDGFQIVLRLPTTEVAG